jgi:DNA (cytosine-5)-methyltransferase 1
MTIKIIDLFAGIGGIRLGFGHSECVFSSDWDKDAKLMYENYFNHELHGDITKINPYNIPNHDILLAGFPCQPFSIMGKSLGFSDTRGTLFFAIEQILKAKLPYAFLLENVKQLVTHDGGRTYATILAKLKELGYYTHAKILNSLDFGLPQKRERIIIVGFREEIEFSFPKPLKNRRSLESILEDDGTLPKSLFASDRIVAERLQKIGDKNILIPSIWHQNKSGNVSILPYSCALRAGASYNYLLVNGKRRLSPREMMRLQGFPDDYPINVSYQAMRKLTGNSVSVSVMKAVANNIFDTLTQRLPAKSQYMLFHDRAA